MAKLSRWLVSLACLATPLVSQAATYWSPHIGADYKYWGVHTSDFYEEVFPRMDNAFDVYVGTRINGFFGVDVGYEKSINVMKTHVFDTDDIIFAEAETPGNSTMIDLRLRSLYAEMNFYAQVARGLEVIFMMGVAKIYPKTHIMHLDFDVGDWIEYRNHTDPFWSGRFGFAGQYNPTSCLGIKGNVTFDQVRRMKYIGEDENQVPFDFAPYRKAVSFGIGLVYSFIPPRNCQ